MEEVKKYLLDIGFDDAHLPELFNDDDKSTYTIPELMQAYTDHKLKLLGIANVSITEGQSCKCGNKTFTHRHSNWIECTSCNQIKVLQD
mgnify:CR=1 FL=1